MNDTVKESVALRINPLIDDSTKYVLSIVIQISLLFVACISGVIANVINIVVYRKQGLNDSITLGFFTLSISDFVVVTTTLPVSLCYLAQIIFPNAPVIFIYVYHATLTTIRQMAYSFSTVVTAFLSIERCCCVILPFKVKTIFTRNRTFLVIMALLLFHIGCSIPVYATQQLRWMLDANTNDTRILRIWFSPERKEVEAFNYTTLSIITPVCAQVVVICSSAIMVNGLRSSSRFRQMATAKGGEKGETEGGLTSRDARLVKAMVFVGGILSICNVPYFGMVCAIMLVPEFNLDRAYHNTFSLMHGVFVFMATVNASVNFLVYYNISKRYRQIFKETFVLQKEMNRKV